MISAMISAMIRLLALPYKISFFHATLKPVIFLSLSKLPAY
jgi:hypothetical protein